MFFNYYKLGIVSLCDRPIIQSLKQKLNLMKRAFNRDEHLYQSNALEEIIKDTIRFFNGTPVVELPPETRF